MKTKPNMPFIEYIGYIFLIISVVLFAFWIKFIVEEKKNRIDLLAPTIIFFVFGVIITFVGLTAIF